MCNMSASRWQSNTGAKTLHKTALGVGGASRAWVWWLGCAMGIWSLSLPAQAKESASGLSGLCLTIGAASAGETTEQGQACATVAASELRMSIAWPSQQILSGTDFTVEAGGTIVNRPPEVSGKGPAWLGLGWTHLPRGLVMDRPDRPLCTAQEG